jgi:hypothetical protein
MSHASHINNDLALPATQKICALHKEFINLYAHTDSQLPYEQSYYKKMDVNN